nr:hypothetical protein [uncultured Flavobacterium sp.]
MSKQSTHEFNLIDGQFYPNEALHVLISLFNSKINYHQLESFSNHIRHGSDLAVSESRVEALRESIEGIKQIIKVAGANGKQLKIQSTVQITFEE